MKKMLADYINDFPILSRLSGVALAAMLGSELGFTLTRLIEKAVATPYPS